MILTSCKGRAGAVGFAAFIRFTAGWAISGSVLGKYQSVGLSPGFWFRKFQGCRLSNICPHHSTAYSELAGCGKIPGIRSV